VARGRIKWFLQGAPNDLADGFFHFSTAGQIRETAEKYFAGQDGLVLIAAEKNRLGEALRFEPSRGGALFPHLYATLALDAVVFANPSPFCQTAGMISLGFLDSHHLRAIQMRPFGTPGWHFGAGHALLPKGAVLDSDIQCLEASWQYRPTSGTWTLWGF
jgi:uncharacterized protein (DUF952 family)